MSILRRLFMLIRILLKSYGFGFAIGGNKQDIVIDKPADGKQRLKKRLKKMLIFLLPLIFLPTIIGLIFLTINTYDILFKIGAEDLLVVFATSLGALLTFFFGIFYIIGVFYYSNDVERLLPLPLKPHEILTGKFFVSVVYEYLTCLFITMPVYIIYGIKSSADVMFYVIMTIVFLLLPVLPLALASILTMIIMRFTTLARNRDKFNTIAGLIVLFLALSFNYIMQKTAGSNDQLAELLAGKGNALAGITNKIFPGSGYASMALASSDIIAKLQNLGIFVIAVAAAFAIFLLIGNALYMKGAIATQSSSSKRRQLRDEDIVKYSQPLSGFRSIVKKEIKIMLRTPIFFMNNIVMNFLWPVFILLPTLTTTGGGGAEIGIDQIRELVGKGALSNYGNSASIVFAALCAFIIFIAGSNGIAASAISREGICFNYMKYIPVSYTTQIKAKTAAGMIFGFAGAVLAIAVAIVLLNIPALFAILLLLISPLLVILPNLAGIIFDLRKPKLIWDNEQKAVKQNMNVLYEMLAAVGMAALIVLLAVKTKIDFPVFFILLAIVILLADIILYKLVSNFSEKQLPKISV